jgi:GPH family glycoside/pentoside/hexuronide:cation symporter
MKKLTLKEKIAYGFGDLGNGFMFDMGQAYLMKFFTDVCGIAAAVAGSIFLITKLFDAFVDPIAGSIIDNMESSEGQGKFRRIMFRSSILLAILSVFVFFAPNFSPTGKIIYGYASYMAWGLCYSFTNIPYGSLGASMTQDVQDRTLLASFRQAGSIGALLITGVVVMPLITMFQNPKVGYPVAVAIMAVFGVISFYVCYKNTNETVVAEKKRERKTTAKEFANTIFSNRPLLSLILMTVFSISAYNIKTAMLIYFCQYNLGDIKLYSHVNFIIIGCSVLGILIMPKMVKLFGKKNAALLGFGISIVADTINFFLPIHLVSFTILASIAFFGISIPNGITWAFVSDTIDYGEWKTGNRREGITYSAFNFSRKLAQSLAGFASGLGLSLIGYIPNAQQTIATLTGIKGLLLLYPAVALVIAGLVLGILYTLSDKKFEEIVEDLKYKKFDELESVV